MQNLLDLLRSNPYGWGNIPGAQKGPEAYPVFDEWGQPHHGVTGNPLYGPDPTLMENLMSLGELPARTVSPYNFDTREMQVPPMLSEPANALSRVSSSGGLPDPQDPQNQHDISTLLMTMFGGNALAPARAGEAGAMRALSDTGKPSLLGSALAGAESKPIRAYHGSRSQNEILKFDADQSMNLGPHFGPLETAELFAGAHPWQWQPGHEDLAGHSPGAFAAEAISNEKPGLLSRLGFGNGVKKTQDRQRIQTHDAATLSEIANSPDGGRILPVDLDFKNALHVPDLVDKANGLWLPSEIAKTLQEHGVSFHADDWPVFDAGDNARPVAPTGDSGSVMSRNKYGANTQENAAANALIRKRLGDAGYDGIKYADGDTGAGHSYIATSPGTVRSATTGETLFSDTGKPSILGSALAGAEQNKALHLEGGLLKPTPAPNPYSQLALHHFDSLAAMPSTYSHLRDQGLTRLNAARTTLEDTADNMRGNRDMFREDKARVDPTSDLPRFHYDLKDADGNTAGVARGYVDGDTMHLDWLGGTSADKTNLGIAGIRSLREQARKDFPGVSNFEGERVSGAKDANEARDRTQSIKLLSDTGKPSPLGAALAGSQGDDPSSHAAIMDVLKKYGVTP